MVRLWLRNEVFDGVIPLRTIATGGAGGGGSPLKSKSSQQEINQQLFSLVSALREVHPTSVRYTTWITEGWRVLHWSEPIAKLFWELLSIYHGEHVARSSESAAGNGSGASSSGGPNSNGENDDGGSGEGSTAVSAAGDGGVGGAAAAVGASASAAPAPAFPFSRQQQPVVEVPIPTLSLFLFLYLSPDSTTSRVSGNIASKYVDVMWTDNMEDVDDHLHDTRGGGKISPRDGGGFSTPGKRSQGGGLSPKGGARRSRSPGSGGGQSPSSPSSSVSPTRARAMRLQARNADEAHRLVFVKRNLKVLLQLVSSDPLALEACEEENFTVSAADVQRLSFLVEGGEAIPADLNTGVELCDYLEHKLTINESLYPLPPSPAAPFMSPQDAAGVSTSHLSDEDDGGGHSPAPHSKQRVSHSPFGAALAHPTAQGLPASVNCVHRTTVVHRQSAETLHLASKRDVHVNHCQEAHIYLLSPFRHATVLGCVDCTIVLGAVGGLVRVMECARVKLVTCCRRITVTNCLDCTFFTFAGANPVLSGDSRGCHFAPYNTTYPSLPEHLRAVNLPDACPPAINLWDSPIDLDNWGLTGFSEGVGELSSSGSKRRKGGAGKGTGGGTTPDSKDNSTDSNTKGGGKGGGGAGDGSPPSSSPSSTCLSASPTLLSPEHFYRLTVPVAAGPEEEVVDYPFKLPSAYAAALRKREAAVEEIQNAISDAELSPQQQKDLEDVVRAKFTEWLCSTGTLRQVLDLVHLEKGHMPNPSGNSNSNSNSSSNLSSKGP